MVSGRGFHPQATLTEGRATHLPGVRVLDALKAPVVLALLLLLVAADHVEQEAEREEPLGDCTREVK